MRQFISGTIALLLIVLAVVIYSNQQYIIDRMTVAQYNPSADVQQLVDRSAMTDRGQFHFYIGTPSIESTQRFNTQCDRREPQSAILGCYASGKIYIFDVPNEQLDGIEEVTAAHEMLHVVFERLDQEEIDRLTPLLEAEYEKVRDESFQERMDYYARNQPGQRINELHSIIGTEKQDISPELEEYYRQYFTDRSIVTKLHAQYETVFNTLSKQVDDLSARVLALGEQVESASLAYNNNVTALNRSIEEFNRRAANGDFASREDFEAARRDLLAQVASLDQERASIDQTIALYERLYAELEALALESSALNKSIDSSLAPAPEL